MSKKLITGEIIEKPMVVGVISDTHGLLRPEAVEALHGSHRILHAGDIGAPEIIEALAHIAPLTAVHGNVDTGPWARALSRWTACPSTSCTTLANST